MLIGDYSAQCSKHLGPCRCQACSAHSAKARRSATRGDWYRRFLEEYSKELESHPDRYREVLEGSQEFLRSLHDRFASNPDGADRKAA